MDGCKTNQCGSRHGVGLMANSRNSLRPSWQLGQHASSKRCNPYSTTKGGQQWSGERTLFSLLQWFASFKSNLRIGVAMYTRWLIQVIRSVLVAACSLTEYLCAASGDSLVTPPLRDPRCRRHTAGSPPVENANEMK